MNSYKVLNRQIYSSGIYSISPLRMKDRYDIMEWRNEQIYHLRQNKTLEKEDQDHYFDNVVINLFNKTQPDQILFSYLENDICIGYGGLVHINWIDQNAEISFIMNTKFEKDQFENHWSTFLALIQEVGFGELKLHKLFTYAFDVRPKLYPVLEAACFQLEAELKEHCFFDGNFISVKIHSKFFS